jgi:DNA-binding MarR family transcriptional regulator
MIDLTAFQQLILLDVAIRERQDNDQPNGLAIKDDLTEMYRGVGELPEGEEVNHGRLYPNLDKLVTRGLLKKGERNRRSNYYALTDAGIQAISSHEAFIHHAQGQDAANPYLPEDPEPAPADD